MASPTNSPTPINQQPTNDQTTNHLNFNGYNAPTEHEHANEYNPAPAYVETPQMAIPMQPTYPQYGVPINPALTAMNIKAFKAQKKAAKEQKKAAKEAKKLALATAKEHYKEQLKEAKERKEAADEYVKEAVRHAKNQVNLAHHAYPICYTCKKMHKTVRFQVQNGSETKSFCSMDCYFKNGKKTGSMHK